MPKSQQRQAQKAPSKKKVPLQRASQPVRKLRSKFTVLVNASVHLPNSYNQVNGKWNPREVRCLVCTPECKIGTRASNGIKHFTHPTCDCHKPSNGGAVLCKPHKTSRCFTKMRILREKKVGMSAGEWERLNQSLKMPAVEFQRILNVKAKRLDLLLSKEEPHWKEVQREAQKREEEWQSRVKSRLDGTVTV